MTRIAIAGFQHETNTFGATKAEFADFELADAWPGLLRGAEVISGTEGSNLPLAGFVQRAGQDASVELIPIVWCSAEPSSFVTDDAFERISGMILEGIRGAGRIDGIYLDLHGAMVTESHQDGEGELLRRVRELVGPSLPVSISLDLHANLTRRMVDLASSITIFRTYPHLDMAETGGRAFDALMHLIGGGRLCAAYLQAPFLVPLQAQYTGAGPCAGLYAQTARVGVPPAAWAELAMGFPAADIHDAGPAVLAYAETPQRAEAMAGKLLGDFAAAEAAFDCTLLSAEDAVARAMAVSAEAGRPVVIADVQDNPGAGGTSDTTGLLRALVSGGARGAVLGMLNDPEIAARAHALGEGGTFEAPLGGKAGLAPDPFQGRFRVEALSEGRFAFTGEMYAGSIADTGPTALLRVLDDRCDLRVVVGSKRCQCLDQAIFRHIGVDPAEARIVAVKSTVHFRADFEPIAAAVLNAEAPGLHHCRLGQVPYRHLRPTVRREPLG
ncbi:MAG TPA: M81 family metallopeptidase [Thermohalobaculum sp.]|nr:M81 family metallopeptidase [Thermohalobaculum sp.]